MQRAIFIVEMWFQCNLSVSVKLQLEFLSDVNEGDRKTLHNLFLEVSLDGVSKFK